MTPLMPAPQGSGVPALPGPGAGAPQPAGTGESFAAALEQGQVALAGEPGDAGMEELPAEVPAEAEVAEGIGAGLPAPLQPPPPWPPAGLAGLGFSRAGDGAAAGPLPALAAFARLASADGDGGTTGAAPAMQLPPGGLAANGTEAVLVIGDGPGSPAPAPAFTLPPLASSSPAQEPPPMLETPLPAPAVRAQDFSERFGAQLQWMASEQIGHARIRVSPQELGPVEVMLRMDGERISADFISAHAETRQALEHGLPRLRDLLGEHGFQLAHAGVGQDSPGSQDDAAPAATGGLHAADEGDEVASSRPAPMAVSNRLLDAYA